MLKKILEIIFSVILIIIGSFLEVYYYISRFQGDGIPFWICVIIGVALTLFLSMAVYSRNKNISKALIIALIIYSILATSAGQSFSYQEIKNKNTVEAVQDAYTIEDIERKKQELVLINTEIEKINKSIEESTQTLEDRWYYRNTLAAAEKTKDDLRSRKDKIEIELSLKTEVAKTHNENQVQSENIYGFYNRLTFGFLGEDFLQFFFQTVLSFFIATMAPLGITIITGTKKRVKKNAKMKPAKISNKISLNIIKKWISINWVGVKRGKSDKIIPRESFEKFMETQTEIITKEHYNDILMLSIRAGLIKHDGTIIERDENKAFKKIKSLT